MGQPVAKREKDDPVSIESLYASRCNQEQAPITEPVINLMDSSGGKNPR